MKGLVVCCYQDKNRWPSLQTTVHDVLNMFCALLRNMISCLSHITACSKLVYNLVAGSSLAKLSHFFQQQLKSLESCRSCCSLVVDWLISNRPLKEHEEGISNQLNASTDRWKNIHSIAIANSPVCTSVCIYAYKQIQIYAYVIAIKLLVVLLLDGMEWFYAAIWSTFNVVLS